MADNLAAAMAAVQAKLPRVHKAETADTGKYQYRYASLADVSEAVLPLLAEHGLSFVCMPTISDGGHFVLVYRLMHVSGEALEGAYPLPTSATPQAQGSAITYARRYTLLSVVGVAPDDDDDGQAAEQAATSNGRRSQAQPDHETLLSKVNELIVQLEEHGVEHDPQTICEYAVQGVGQAQATIRRLTGMLPA